MPEPGEPAAQDFVPYATAALDFHRALNLPAGPLVADRSELNALHAHLISLHGLLDAHTARARPLLPSIAEHLRTACTRIWLAADSIHSAYHATPRPLVPESPGRSTSALTICRRHQQAAHLVRRRTTPAELREPFTGLVRP